MITIIKPPSNDNYWRNGIPPYPIASINGYLSKDFRVAVDDLEIKVWAHNINNTRKINLSYFCHDSVVKHCIKEPNTLIEKESKKILKLTDTASAAIVAFYVEYPNEFVMALPLAKLLWERGKTIVFVGEFFKNICKVMKTYGFIDFIIYDSGEHSLKLFLEGEKKENIPNFIWREGDLIKKSSCNKILNLNKIRPPLFDGLDLGLYRKYTKLYFGIDKLILSYRLSQGCINNCFFCGIPKYSYFNTRKTDRVARDLRELSYRYKSDLFYFLDNSFTVSNQYVKKLSAEIISAKLGLTFIGFSLYDYLDEEAIYLLSKSGCKGLCFGVESTALARTLRKNKNIEKLPYVLKLCKENDIWTHLFFISDLPLQGLRDIYKDIKFIEENKGCIDSVLINEFQLHLNSDMYKNPTKYGIESLNHTLAPYKRAIPYTLKHNRKSSYIKVWEKMLNQMKILNFEPDKCLQFLFNSSLKSEVISNRAIRLSNNTDSFLEGCRNYLSDARR